MKNLKKIAAVALIGYVITLTSCKKESTTPSAEEPAASVPQPTFNNANVQTLISSLATPLESYTINAANNFIINCANGTNIFIAPNAFLTMSGSPVTGFVTIETKDVLSKKDMILNNALPVSNEQLLVSGGEVYFNATQGGQKLKMNPASSVYINVPAGNSPSSQMREFYATGGSNLSNSNLNWTTNTATIAAVQDTTGGLMANYYSFQSDSLNWSNCDYFYGLPGAKTTCTVNLTGSFNNTNSAVFLSMNGVTTLVRLNSSFYNTSQEFHSYANSIPEGVSYTVVVIGFDGSNYYYGTQVVTMTTNMVINMPTLIQVTKSQIETNLSTLP